ncbi:myelin protein zero-like protein 1 isoform X2 [Heteronotia binoei]|uniref:myelin protein zero-like protein 1 isoform X2 n=1 Tax=Heteronotia binoei TaxID=13085 RepID=UPI00292D6F9F|nr:myelin protein zero-like protein 1 isoform X2 [Heteronotia binoei]
MASLQTLASVLVVALGLSQVSAVEVYTPGELTVINGREAKLECIFTSTEVISSAASVTWSFQAQGAPSASSFFYYSNGKAYTAKDVSFMDRISWAGDLYKKDASIKIANIRFRDNGTYICDVKNPPDTVVTTGKIRLRVVERDCDSSTRSIICLAIGAVILVLLVFIVITDHLFWKEQRCKMLKPLANMENNQRFPSDHSRTTRLSYENVHL